MRDQSQGFQFSNSFCMDCIAHVTTGSDDMENVWMVRIDPGCRGEVQRGTVKYELCHGAVVVMFQDLVRGEVLRDSIQNLGHQFVSYFSCPPTSGQDMLDVFTRGWRHGKG